MSESVTSADQDAWLELARTIRAMALKVAPTIPTMTPEDMKHFTEMAQNAFFLEQCAAAYDHRLELELNKIGSFDCGEP